MVLTLLLLTLPVLTSCSNDGNIHLLEEEVADALRTCQINDRANQTVNRHRRTSNVYQDPSPRIDANSKQDTNQYDHERRNTSFVKTKNGFNGSNFEYDFEAADGEANYVYKIPKHAHRSDNANTSNYDANSTRTKRNEPLISKDSNEVSIIHI